MDSQAPIWTNVWLWVGSHLFHFKCLAHSSPSPASHPLYFPPKLAGARMGMKAWQLLYFIHIFYTLGFGSVLIPMLPVRSGGSQWVEPSEMQWADEFGWRSEWKAVLINTLNGLTLKQPDQIYQIEFSGTAMKSEVADSWRAGGDGRELIQQSSVNPASFRQISVVNTFSC